MDIFYAVISLVVTILGFGLVGVILVDKMSWLDVYDGLGVSWELPRIIECGIATVAVILGFVAGIGGLGATCIFLASASNQAWVNTGIFLLGVMGLLCLFALMQYARNKARSMTEAEL